MDFLEGLFLGKVWADSDTRPRIYHSFYLILSLIILILSAGAIFSDKLWSKIVIMPQWLAVILALGLTLGLPWLSSYYYRQKLPAKLGILCLFVVQYYAVYQMLMHFIPTATGVKLSSLVSSVLLLGEQAINFGASITSFLGGLTSSIFGIFIGSILLGILFLIVLAIALLIPIALICLLRFIHHSISQVIYHKVFAPKWSPSIYR